MWFKWNEYQDQQDYQMKTVDVNNCGYLFLEVLGLNEDVVFVYKSVRGDLNIDKGEPHIGNWMRANGGKEVQNKSNLETNDSQHPNHWLSPVPNCNQIITSRNGKEYDPRAGIGIIIFNEEGELKLVAAEGRDGFKVSSAFVQGIKGAYWPSWLVWTLPPSSIPTTYFTYLFCAFVVSDATTYQLSITQLDDQWIGNFTTTFHRRIPSAKTFLAIGGGAASPYTFSNMWCAALEQEPLTSGKPRLLISAAVYFASNFLLAKVPYTYPGNAIREYVGSLNPMCFDYNGAWNTLTTRAHALIYDKSSKLKDPNDHGIGAPAVGVGPGNERIMQHKDIVDFNSANKAIVVYDNTTVSAYSYSGTHWIRYDVTISIGNKIRLRDDAKKSLKFISFAAFKVLFFGLGKLKFGAGPHSRRS
ncbi:hypothetical protein ACH5RR_039055 [Cinchona calisaya]|uniref:Chitinase II/V-like catalytic domain-containing protein n=1 Tax=Cinchona calisaya TaxID=153742 RepID=A0ABD2XX43_9GENT